MRYSQLLTRTNKEAREFDSINATLLQKGGFIDQVMAGVYAFLPLGLKVLTKIEDIIRQEMDDLGSELLLPALSPKMIWEKTERLDIDILFKVSGANEASVQKNSTEFILNPTHEDVVTPIARKHRVSYRDFPFAVYQIQSKYRNEARPKSGLLRGREFRMKDLYSFHASEDDLRAFYEKVKVAYGKIFEKVGIAQDTVIALASGGDFTKDYSHEFQTFCETGEDTIFIADGGKVIYNKEVAPSMAPEFIEKDNAEQPLEEVEGVGIIGVKEIAEFLNLPVEKTTKTLLFETDEGKLVAAAVRGDYEINAEKLCKVINCKKVELAAKETVKKVTGAEIGYLGIINLPAEVRVVLDDSLKGRVNFEMGANRTNYHSVNVNFGRDLEEPEEFFDIKIAREGDLYPVTGEKYEVKKASEVANIFPLNTKFTKAFNYVYSDKDGNTQDIYMGSYGLGSTRLMGLLVEKYHDDKGIVWPKNVAPFHVHLVGLNLDEEDIKKKADKVYKDLVVANVEVLYDDRVESSPGEKFADADLIGIPWRVVVSKKTGDKIEIKRRGEDDFQNVTVNEFAKLL